MHTAKYCLSGNILLEPEVSGNINLNETVTRNQNFHQNLVIILTGSVLPCALRNFAFIQHYTKFTQFSSSRELGFSKLAHNVPKYRESSSAKHMSAVAHDANGYGKSGKLNQHLHIFTTKTIPGTKLNSATCRC